MCEDRPAGWPTTAATASRVPIARASLGTLGRTSALPTRWPATCRRHHPVLLTALVSCSVLLAPLAFAFLFRMQASLPTRYRQTILLAFFSLLFAGGLRLVPDYGLTYDEVMQRVTGEVSLLYVFQKLPPSLQRRWLPPQAAALIAAKGAAGQLGHYHDREYGVAFELPAAASEQLLRLHDSRERFLLRHYLTFMVCFAGLFAFYRLAAQRYASWRVGLLGVLLLVLSPRLFADCFYNSKDAVFTMLFTLAVATTVLFVRRPSWRTALGHALACAVAIDVRVMAVLVPAATLAFVGLQVLRGAYGYKRAALALGLYCTLLPSLVIAFWPYLWEAPASNFLAVLRTMSHYRWPGQVVYQGHVIAATAIPWHYPFVWIGLTVPLVYIAFWLVGTAGVLRRLGHIRQWAGIEEADWQDLLFLGLGLAPLLAVVVLHSVLYNGWRHLYFVYPLLLLLALRGLVGAWRWQAFGRWQRYWRPALSLVVGSLLIGIAVRMVRLHPLENLYFNAFAPAPINKYFETDYWNMGLFQSLTWLVQHDARARIRVSSNLLPSVAISQLLLPAGARQRLLLTPDPAQADYYFDIDCYPHPAPYARPRYALWAERVHVLSLYQLPQPVVIPAPRAANRAGE